MTTETETKDENNITKKSQLYEKSGLHFAKTQMIDDIKSKLSKRCVIEEAEDYLIYGLEIRKVDDKGKIKDGIIYIKPNEDNKLIFLKKKNKSLIEINLYKLIDITYGKSSGCFNLINPKVQSLINDNCCITLHMNDFKFIDFIVYEEIKLDYFCVGILSFLEKNIKDSKNVNSYLLSLKKIWKEYDINLSKFLNIDQFSKFLLTINFKWKKKTNLEIFNEIDKKKIGKINFKDFLFFYEKIVTGEEFREVFQKYSSDLKKKYINLKGFMDFLEKEQKQKLSIEAATEIMKKFSIKNKKIDSKEKENIENLPKNHESSQIIYENYMNTFNEEDKETINNLKINFREFVNILIDRNINSVYNNDFFSIHQNMDLPLIDYFIFSSHNTYLTGNQMIGTSSIEMYKYCLNNGCRLVELDCWDGSSGPIITHWHFPVSKLNFKEVLKNIKKYAFKKNEFPVILSVENHCNDENQLIMYQDLIEVFGEGEMFVIDKKNPPLIYPSPNELKRKIIVKCRRKRFLKNAVNTHTSSLLKFSPRKIENSLSSNLEANDNEEVQQQKLQILSIDKNNLVKQKDIIQEIQEINSKDNSDEENIIEDKNMIITPQSSKNCKLKATLDLNSNYQINYSNEILSYNLISEEEKKTDRINFKNSKKLSDDMNSFLKNDNNFNNSFLKSNNEDQGKIHINFIPSDIIYENDKEMIKDTPINEIRKNSTQQNITNSEDKLENIEKNDLNLKNIESDIKECESFTNKYFNEDIQNNNISIKKIKEKNCQSFVSADSERYSENDIDLGFKKNHTTKFPSALIQKLKEKYSTKLYSKDLSNTKRKSLVIETNIDNKSITEAIHNFQELQAKQKLEKHYTITALSSVIGMIGIPFNNHDFDNLKNLPWECVSLSEPEYNAFISSISNKLKVIKYCQKSFLKIYPNILRTDSSNHDPVKTWICGAQICALNLQSTDDDYILINKIFFKINGGSRSGYILKPDYLRNQELTLDSLENRYIRPAFKIKFKVLSGFHLHTCFPINKKIKGIYVEVSVRGSKQDDDNPKLVTSTIIENFLHPKWKSNSVEFEIYESELAFFVIKLFSKDGKDLLARGVIPIKILNLGYRILDLYDMACTKFEQSFLIIKTNKIFV